MPMNEYIEYREVDAYRMPRVSRMNGLFFNRSQEQVFKDIYTDLRHLVPEQRYLDVVHMRKKPYFAEAMELCDQFGLEPIMTAQCD